jgi:subtilisin family serine protease
VAALAFTTAGAATAAQATPFAPTTSTAAAAEPGILMNYVVNTKATKAHVKKVEKAVKAAGGTVVSSYDQLGVVIAQSTNPDFRTDVRKGRDGREVQSVGATRTAAVSEGPVGTAAKAAPKGLNAGESTVVPDPDETKQWDMVQIKADQAHQITDGSKRVLVGVTDSGVDDTHPDLAPNFDAKNSVNCTGNGVADRTPGGWRQTTSDHGTHVAGTIAAARNGVGIVGVAPGVKIASVKVVNDDGYIYPEYAICGFVWAAEHHMDVTNHSYFIDPWQFWCEHGGDPDDHQRLPGHPDRAARRDHRRQHHAGPDQEQLLELRPRQDRRRGARQQHPVDDSRRLRPEERYLDGVAARGRRRRADEVDAPVVGPARPGEGPAAPGRRHRVPDDAGRPLHRYDGQQRLLR